MAEYSVTEKEINTLEDSLAHFEMECCLEQLDMTLDLVRRNKLTEKEHLDGLKIVDTDLRKKSRTYHPDKATNEMKSQDKLQCAQKAQVALNATRTVLRALTEAFLKDIDVLYRYQFFAKMDISSMINEKEMDRQITNVLSKIGFLSEVKSVNIVGEIRKFLQESRKCLRIYLDDDEDEFSRYRDYALRHLYKCIEGYEVFVRECELVLKDCRGEQHGCAMATIRKVADQSQIELEILQNLKKVAEKSLNGNYQLFSIHKKVNSYDPYHILPFVLYINVMLMCTTVINSKSKLNFFARREFKGLQCDLRPELFFEAYNLAAYFNNRSASENILKDIDPIATENRKKFKCVVQEIANFLSEEFDIKSYKEGKSNRERFVEKMSKFDESIFGYKEVEKLKEMLDMCKKGTDKIRKDYFEYSEKMQETEDQCRKNILKCKSSTGKISKLISGCDQKVNTQSSSYFRNEENEAVNCTEIREDLTEAELSKKLKEYRKVAENLLDFLTECRESISEFTGSRSGFGSQNEYIPVITDEIEKKIKVSCELSQKINEQLNYLMTQTSLEQNEM